MYNPKETEEKILEFWRKNKTFEKSLEKTKKEKSYIFYDGPPFATGLPHYGHILASVLKDAFPRFWTMKGRYVKRRWGWDCHGLPIENVVEKELGIKSKDEIEKIGVKKFNDTCRNKVLTYAGEWGKTVERIGRWVEFENAYKTMDNSYIESVWWAFKQLWNKGYIYEGEKVLLYCPRCSTPLSKSEIAMDNSYKMIKDRSITIKFKLKEKYGKKDVYALAWTTTPWTLPSNLGLTVNPKLEYAYLEDNKDGIIYLLGNELISQFFKDAKEYTILKIVKGKELENKEYEPLFPYYPNKKDAYKILLGEFVTSADGTGIVHTAPYGEDDYEVFKKYNIKIVEPVDEKGHFKPEVKDFPGEYIFDTNEKIIEFLKKQGKIVAIRKVEHEYPFCYRCETPLIYMPLPAWFVNIQKIKPRVLELNKKLNWYPEFLKEGRFKHSVETAPDWNISRNRYWASAIPAWKCSKCKEIEIIGSIEELKKKAINLPKGEVDLHKDFLDPVKLKCSKCKSEMQRVPEVLDCWFESGSMPFAQFHYPFENKEFFEKNFPAQFVVEYIGQVRAWFYYMIVLSTILFDEIPFENVLTTGTILAEDGQKMSKSKGNYPDPNILIEKYGVDALRFYLLSTPVMNADNVNFSEKGVDEVYKKVVLLLSNVNNFYTLYYKIDDGKKPKLNDLMDQWIVSRLNELIKNEGLYMEDYNTIKSCNEIKSFIEDLSTWYIRRTRERFNEEDKEAVRVLRYVLEESSKVFAPIIPFISETIYQTLGNKESVHLQNWPKYQEKEIDEKIVLNMNKCREIVSEALKERDKAQTSLKWPLAKVIISYNEKLSEEYEDVLKAELNVRKIEWKKSDVLKIELDTKLTKELEEEGYARELMRRVQSLRKESGLKKEDQIELYIEIDVDIKKWKEQIIEKCGSKKLEFKIKDCKFKNEGEIKNKKFFVGFNVL